eukprot:m51a1_g2294 hypothetical protein (281) ;mRNA; f:418858-419700
MPVPKPIVAPTEVSVRISSGTYRVRLPPGEECTGGVFIDYRRRLRKWHEACRGVVAALDRWRAVCATADPEWDFSLQLSPGASRQELQALCDALGFWPGYELLALLSVANGVSACASDQRAAADCEAFIKRLVENEDFMGEKELDPTRREALPHAFSVASAAVIAEYWELCDEMKMDLVLHRAVPVAQFDGALAQDLWVGHGGIVVAYDHFDDAGVRLRGLGLADLLNRLAAGAERLVEWVRTPADTRRPYEPSLRDWRGITASQRRAMTRMSSLSVRIQ